MRKIFILMLALVLTLAGCNDSASVSEQQSSEAVKEEINEGINEGINEEASNNNETAADITSLPDKPKNDTALPYNYPKELPLAADAEIIDVRENPASKGLEVIYVSDNDIDTLRDFYEVALNGSKDLGTLETTDGYWISANMDGIDYTIMLSEDAMNPNPQYAGKISVYIIIAGLEGINDDFQMTEDEGETWPSADLPGVPQLKGHISQILWEDGIIRLEITVENAENVKSYIEELTAAGFSFDTQPDVENDHMEFLAFKDSSMMSFAYKGEENLASIEYQK